MAASRLSRLVLAMGGAAGACAFAPPDDGRFFAVQAVTADPQRFAAQWAQPGAHVDLAVDSRFARGTAATAFVIFSNCRPDAKGACDVQARFSLLRPDGSVEYTVATGIWKRPPLGHDIFMRAMAAPTFRFKADDRPGVYRMKAEIVDRVSGETITTTTPITYG